MVPVTTKQKPSCLGSKTQCLRSKSHSNLRILHHGHEGLQVGHGSLLQVRKPLGNGASTNNKIGISGGSRADWSWIYDSWVDCWLHWWILGFMGDITITFKGIVSQQTARGGLTGFSWLSYCRIKSTCGRTCVMPPQICLTEKMRHTSPNMILSDDMNIYFRKIIIINWILGKPWKTYVRTAAILDPRWIQGNCLSCLVIRGRFTAVPRCSWISALNIPQKVIAKKGRKVIYLLSIPGCSFSIFLGLARKSYQSPR